MKLLSVSYFYTYIPRVQNKYCIEIGSRPLILILLTYLSKYRERRPCIYKCKRVYKIENHFFNYDATKVFHSSINYNVSNSKMINQRLYLYNYI